MSVIQNFLKKISRYSYVNDRPYLTLAGSLTQAGTAAPTFASLENSLGVTPTLARTGTGVYTLVIASAFVANAVLLPAPFAIDNATSLIYGSWARTDANTLTLTTESSHGVAADLVATVPVEVKVYV